MTKQIVVVDDDALQLKLTSAILSDAGFRVTTAGSAAEGLAKAIEVMPDAIVSDVLMRDCDGFQFCRQVRAEPALASVPVVLVSAHFSAERDRDLAAAVGANGYAERTPDFSAELEQIRRVLGTQGATPAEDSGALYAERVSEQLSQLLDKARAADMRYRTLFETASDGLVIIDSSGVIVEVNRRMEEITGFSRTHVVGRHFSEFSLAENAELDRASFAANLKGHGASSTVVTRPDGSRVHLQFRTSTIVVDGQPLMLAIGRDVTSEIADRERLAASEAKYRRLIENLSEAVWVSDLNSNQLDFLTSNIVDLTGFTQQELSAMGRSGWYARMHPDDQQNVMEGAQAMAANGTAFDVEYRWQHKNGSWRWLRVRAHGSAEGTSALEGLLSDVTARRKLEDEFRQAQKMEALGRLTGGVAHDFNNLLCVILANSEMLLRTVDPSDPRVEDIKSVREAGERAAGLTRQLLAFSRKAVLQPKLLSLGTVMQGVEKLLRRVIGEDVRLNIQADADLPHVLADAGQLEQVLMNLSVNARDAMPAGGELTLSATSVKLSNHEVDHLPEGVYVRLDVTDTGCGMDPEIQQKIFEPFFTTKAAGKGTGLGLSTCYGIVTQSGGAITVKSALGAGTTFTVYLPRAAGDGAAASDDAPAQGLKGGTETVLVVEDDDALRRTLDRGLQRLGYRVLLASNGEEAERAYRAHRDQITLVLSDIVLPGKSGLETVMQLRADQFAGKVLFMSGYTDRPELHEVLGKTNARLLQKPFQRDVLARTLREVIDGVPA